jgi:putative mRNA 3-end processing factor
MPGQPQRLIVNTDRGLYCPAGEFFIDPWQPVDRAIITHGHSDHARPGSKRYLAANPGLEVLRHRLAIDEGGATIEGLAYGQRVRLNDVIVSLHPAGHLLGSAQVRLERDGETWVVSGDYKLHRDPTCDAFEPIACDTFITECTFGLPIYRWPAPEVVFDEIHSWWRENQQLDRTSIIFAYALGKAQRLLAGLDESIGPILAHGAIARFNEVYERAGVRLPAWKRAEPETIRAHRGRAMVIAPPSAISSPWLRRFGELSTAFASGWMLVRGTRRRSNVDRGFALSDHIDWPGLLESIEATGARAIGVTHGNTDVVARHLAERGYHATVYATQFSSRGEEQLGDDGNGGNGGNGGDHVTPAAPVEPSPRRDDASRPELFDD